MTNEEIIEKIRTTLAEEFEIDVEQIQPDAPLMQTLELDSLDLVDMVVLIDKKFSVSPLQPKILPVSKPSRISIIW